MYLCRLLPPLRHHHRVSRVCARPGSRLLRTFTTKGNEATELIDDLYRDPADPDYMRHVWKDWHQTTVPLPAGWSCQWGLWMHTPWLFDPEIHTVWRTCSTAPGLLPAKLSLLFTTVDGHRSHCLFSRSEGGITFTTAGRRESGDARGEFAGHEDFLRQPAFLHIRYF
ncbi:hypothetical protein C8F04DRAFT_1123713 [Mycena alexandri]|uniref:Uncharacterized protein n=1 Tax=Mycena alexandri TaxID=1745969 RepID=A0AAD6SH35_9AGAR|nr:hypothetical protein C8F04DRAFT_1123713 [Mycena alexandri]